MKRNPHCSGEEQVDMERRWCVLLRFGQVMIGRDPKITLEASDIHLLCNVGINSKQVGGQNEPQTIISRCEFRYITQSTMQESPLWKT